ncbi:MAG: ABC transporter ATP-binding protein [Erysipelotrichaceae bacterium]
MSEHFEEQEFNTDTLDTHLWRKIFKLLWIHKKKLAVLYMFIIMVAAVDVLFPYLNKIAIDTFINGNGDLSHLTWFGIAYFGCIVWQGFNIYFFIKQAGLIEMDFAYDVRNKAFTKLQELSFSYYDKTPLGWIMARMTSDITRLAEILSWSLMDLVWGSTVMIGITVVMFSVNWQLALLVLMVMPILAAISVWFQRRILKSYREVRKVNSKITGAFSEGITGAKTTKTLVLEEVNYDEFSALTHTMRSQSIKAAILSAIFMPIVMSLGSISTAAILWYGGNQVLLGALQFGTLMLFTQYASQFFEPLRQIARLLAEFQMAQASAERVLSLLGSEPQIIDTPEVIEKYGSVLSPKREAYEKIKGNVTFEGVNFHYNPEEPVLKDFNLEVKSGQTIALVGETGSGKSTIVNLLCRFYEPITGRILIDGVDMKERSIGWLHSNLGYVLQSPHLFSGSVRDNIRYGKLDATEEEVVAAAKLVDAHSFIEKLEQGYDTDVGEGGGRLSTGQKQLISFARAVIAEPAIFVLDEATSSIDTETEQVIQHAIETLLVDRTSFVIAHRLSTIVTADRILVVRKGRVVEDGTHGELMKKKGYYYRLYTNQFNEDLQDKLLKIA